MGNFRQNKAITLIALIITIIILLIIAGISIVTLTGENGILKKASSAGEQTRIEEYKEILIIIGNGLRSEKILEDLSTKEYMDRYQKAIEEETEKGDTFEGAKVERKNEGTIVVTTKENYIYIVKEDEVKYIGKEGETTPPVLQEGDIEFILTPNKWTNQNVNVEIKSKIDGYTIQYSMDGENWEEYKEKIIVSQNVTIYARLTNGLEETEGSATKAIDIIDKELPNEATITLSSTNVSAGTNVIATVTQSDRGVSGIDIANCRWVLTTSASPIGTMDTSKYSGGGFTKEEAEELTLSFSKTGNFYLHVLTQDKAGNRIEKISNQISATDKTPPNQAIIALSNTSATIGTNINATVTQSDNQSGIDIQNCRWVFTANANEIGMDSSKYTGGQFTKEEEVLTINCSGIGNYYLHVLSQDKAGNKIETISDKVVISGLSVSLVSGNTLPSGKNPTLVNALGKGVTFEHGAAKWFFGKFYQNNGVTDSIFWEIDCPSDNGTVTTCCYFNHDGWFSNPQQARGLLFVSTVKPSTTWSPEKATVGTCKYVELPFRQHVSKDSDFAHITTIDFSGTRKIYVGLSALYQRKRDVYTDLT